MSFLWHFNKETTEERRERRTSKRTRGPWLVGSRRSSPSRRTPRRQQRRRKVKALTRRPQRRRRWSTPAPSAGHKCLTPRHSSSTSKANIPSRRCLLSWPTFRHKGPTGPDLKLDPL